MSTDLKNNNESNKQEVQEEQAPSSADDLLLACDVDETQQQQQHIPIIMHNPFTLTDEERVLFSALQAAADCHFQENDNRSAATQQEASSLLSIRVAGGWVRDKLLNLTSDDIDVTLDKMSGVQFAEMVREYLLKQDDHHSYKIGVIAANPSQSKHLETATMTLFGFHVDFCHLRAEETYHFHSRIPVYSNSTTETMTFGTPYEDAMRRDFTINSLFYNLRDGTVEDYTGRGIHDLLSNGTIVTPLDAHETFHDDPLRILRAIRFSMRFQYPIHDTIREAARSREVQDSLMRKVSRERVGTELEGMLTGKAANPRMALAMICELGLSDAVFRISVGKEDDDGDDDDDDTRNTIGGSIVYHHDVTVLVEKENDGDDIMVATTTADTHTNDVLEGNTNDGPSPHPSVAYQNTASKEERELLRRHGWCESLQRLKLADEIIKPYKGWAKTCSNTGTTSTPLDERTFILALYLSPFKDLAWQEKLKRNRVVSMSMIKTGIKFPNRDVDAIECIMEHLDLFVKELRRTTTTTTTSDSINDSNEKSFSRLEAGILLRKVKERWVTCLLLAGCIELRRSTCSYYGNESSSSSHNSAVQACENFYRFVHEQNLDHCWKLQPLINGKEIMKTLNIKGGGPIVGQLVDEQWRWMLQYPQSSKEECKVFLEHQYSSMINK